MQLLPYLFTILFTYTGLILSNYYYYQYSHKNGTKKKGNLRYFLVPFKYSKSKKNTIVQLFGAITFTIFAISILLTFFQFQSIHFFEVFFFILFFGSVFYQLFTLSVNDFLFYAIPESKLYRLVLTSVAGNLVVVIMGFIGFDWQVIQNGTFLTLLVSLAFGLIFFLLVNYSKEKAMGQGDIYLIIAFSLALGYPNALVGMFFTLIIGSFAGIIYMIIKKQTKGLILPFAPLLTLGFAIAIGFSNTVIELLFV